MADLWAQLQSNPSYKDQTTLIISTDHGRGSGPEDWKEHGTGQPGSENIWIAVIGPDTPALGERQNISPVTQAQLAATVAGFVGENLQSASPRAAPPLLEALGTP
jgi:hypothetical protein